MTQSQTQDLADFAAKVTFDDLPTDVVHQTKRVIFDTIGCALGAFHTERARITRTLVENLGGKAESTVLGTCDKTSCTNATLANGNAANALDFDEVFGNMWHPGVSLVPSSLAVAERERTDGKALITAVVVGYDIAIRIGMSPDSLYMRNGEGHFMVPELGHSWKVFGAACATGKLLRLSSQQMTNAIGLAAMVTPFTTFGKWMVPADSLPMSKYIDNGWMGMGGVTTAMLAGLGYTGPTTLVDNSGNSWGLPEGMKRNTEFLVGNLGQKWWITDTSFKPWPCVTSGRHAITAADRIVREHGLRVQQIDKISVKGGRINPVASVMDPQSPATMQFNIRYNLTNFPFNVIPGPHWQDRIYVDDPEMKEFRRKVVLEFDPGLHELLDSQATGSFPRAFFKFPTTVEVTSRGKEFRETVGSAKGDPWNPDTIMTDDELKAKFRVNASETLPKEKIEKAIQAIYDLEDMSDIGELAGLLSRNAQLSKEMQGIV